MIDRAYSALFLRCMEVILGHEGGYVNHHCDPGGETNMGIAKRFYPDLDIKNLTKDQAVEIYFRDYWLKLNLTGIMDASAVLDVFDMGVNAGLRTAVKMAQKIVGAFADGVIGEETIRKINSYPASFVEIYKAHRKVYYVNLSRRKPELRVFLAGWLNRVDTCKFM